MQEYSSLVQSTMSCARQFEDDAFVLAAKHVSREHELLLKRLKLALASGVQSKIKYAKHLLLTSAASKLCCALRNLPEKHGLTAEEIVKISKSVSVFHDCGERITLRWDKKKSGKGYRPIYLFGPKRRMCHRLVTDMLEAMHGVDPCDYMARGRGPELASDWVADKAALGTRYFVAADIKNYFPSVQLEKIGGELGLPKAVVTNCIAVSSASLLRERRAPYRSPDETLKGTVHHGLPQGSLASQFIASWLLGRALRSLVSADQAIFIGDDGLIAACDEQEANNVMKALAEHMHAHPYGPFFFKRLEVVDVLKSFNWVKYRFRQKKPGGEVRCTPSWSSWRGFRRKSVDLHQDTPPGARREELETYRTRWRDSFRRWKWNAYSDSLLTLTQALAIYDIGPVQKWFEAGWLTWMKGVKK